MDVNFKRRCFSEHPRQRQVQYCTNNINYSADKAAPPGQGRGATGGVRAAGDRGRSERCQPALLCAGGHQGGRRLHPHHPGGPQKGGHHALFFFLFFSISDSRQGGQWRALNLRALAPPPGTLVGEFVLFWEACSSGVRSGLKSWQCALGAACTFGKMFHRGTTPMQKSQLGMLSAESENRSPRLHGSGG